MFRTGVSSITAPGAVLGTISFLAPEALASPKEVDGRVDIFSLGCILYLVLAGKLPFPGETIGDISYGILNQAPPPLETRRFSPELCAAVMRCLEKDREKRPTLNALHDELKKTVGPGYHAFQEKLIDFIRHGRREAASPSQPQAVVPQQAKKSRLLALQWAAVGVLVVAAAVLFFFAVRPGRVSSPALPQLPSMNAGQMELGQVHRTQDKTGSVKKKIPLNGPAPVTGTSLDMQEGVLAFMGLGVQDTVFLNGTPMPHVERSGNAARLRIAPGFYTVEIRGTGGRPVQKKVDVLPYQKMTLDLAKERDSDAGKR
jgi:hypothetical protein